MLPAISIHHTKLNLSHQYQKRNNAVKRPVPDDDEAPAEADEKDDVGDDDLVTHPHLVCVVITHD